MLSFLGIGFGTVLVVSAVVLATSYSKSEHDSTATSSESSPSSSTLLGGPAASAANEYGYNIPYQVPVDLDQWLPVATDFGLKMILDEAIDPPNSIPGSLRAAISGTCPDYAFTWIRDQALVFQALLERYETEELTGDEKNRYETVLRDFGRHAAAIYAKNLNSNSWSLGDAKVEMDGSDFTGEWCDPQTDGPALRATVLQRFALRYDSLNNGGQVSDLTRELYKASVDGSTATPIKRDLEYTAKADFQACEPWEEVRAYNHFYNLVQIRRALIHANEFTNYMSDPGAGNYYNSMIGDLERRISDLYSPSDGYIFTSTGGRDGQERSDDIQKILAVIHSQDVAPELSGYDSFFGPDDYRVIATAGQILSQMEKIYRINQLDHYTKVPEMGLALGRYSGDVYNGGCSLPESICPAPCLGQPWFLATNGMGEYMYKLALVYLRTERIDVSHSTTKRFFTRIGLGQLFDSSSPSAFTSESLEFQRVIAALIHAGDAQLQRTAGHADNYHMHEQYNADTGKMMSAGDLTWSYASLVTAERARKYLNPGELLPSFTDSMVDLHFIVSKVPDDVADLVLTFGPDGPCVPLSSTHRIQILESAPLSEYSAFVQVTKNTQGEVAVRNGGCSGSVMATLAATTPSTTPASAVYLVWGQGVSNRDAGDDGMDVLPAVLGGLGGATMLVAASALIVLKGKKEDEGKASVETMETTDASFDPATDF